MDNCEVNALGLDVDEEEGERRKRESRAGNAVGLTYLHKAGDREQKDKQESFLLLWRLLQAISGRALGSVLGPS
jgi:hypothetical protein